MDSDFTFTNHGSVVILAAESDAARDYLAEHFAQATRWGAHAVVVEPRYAPDVARGLFDEGFVIAAGGLV